MSEKSGSTTSNQLTLFAEDSPASRSVLPGSVEARKMTVTSGLSISDLCESCSHDLSLLKMFLESSIWHSTRCYLIWKAKDIGTSSFPTEGKKSGRLLFQLAPSMPRTDGTGCSLWPTATTQETEHPDAELTDTGRRASKDGNTSHSLGLADAVRMWPTPRDGKTTDENEDSWRERNERGEVSTPPLTLAVKIGAPEQSGSLNPTWVEWLMGFPLGWTDLSASETP